MVLDWWKHIKNPHPWNDVMPYDPEAVEPFKQMYRESVQKLESQPVEDVSEASILDVFNNAFINRYTTQTRNEFLSYWEIDSADDLSTIPEHDFESYVTEYTVFDDSDEMLEKAGIEWVADKLGFNAYR